ncbi:MAG: UDP-N-acetylglucosamine 1-carboxyvinyltransferase [Planctomycetes bacterium]|jgi:UDP-N-acetylglucosamine 1-carboxyvinyltransferase|nr:UDP-N-acetylglucosamine 1-carboxyvinyltransferase [Planctomycetota bacterium]
MDKFLVEGGARLRGEVTASGAKNAALPILAAVLLSDGPVRLRRVPRLADVDTMLRLLEILGVRAERRPGGETALEVVSDREVLAPHEVVSQMRASFCVMGPLLARRGRARVSMPGGCAIGVRPVDIHLRGFQGLGATVAMEGGTVEAAGPLRGSAVDLGGPSGSTVTGTANVLMAATLAPGTTVLTSAACEPEVVDLAGFLSAMGARIRGAGTPRIEVEGVERLAGCAYEIPGDRIETGTFLAAAAATGGDVRVRGCSAGILGAVLEFLRRAGAEAEADGDGVRAAARERLRGADVTARPYPGFPTDMQSQVTAMLATAGGTSVVTDTIFPDRFTHVAELARMGARIRKEAGRAVIEGVESLSGAPVMASDLRAGAALVIAGLAARGTTEVRRIYHIDRGYEDLAGKFSALGAKIARVPESPAGEAEVRENPEKRN